VAPVQIEIGTASRRKGRNSRSKGKDAKTIFVHVIHKDDEAIKVIFWQEVARRKPRMTCEAELVRRLSFGPMDLSLGHAVISHFSFAIIHPLPVGLTSPG
jgi:hypothetical protein